MKKVLILLIVLITNNIFVLGAVSEDQFGFVSNQDGSSVGVVSLSSHQTLEYSLDGVTWRNMTTETIFSLNKNVVLYVRGKLTSNNAENNFTQFTINGSVEVKGNINYLWDYEDLKAQLKEYCGYHLFSGSTGIFDASNLILPNASLTRECYHGMFMDCTKLTTAPSLPATRLASYCYVCMFKGCVSLISAPSLPSTELANKCYANMFQGCASLKSAPALPAIQMKEHCYQGMFSDCSSLIIAPELPATVLAYWCYGGMFENCSSLTSAPKLPATVLSPMCYKRMFANCANLIKTPELPAITLDAHCYNQMFSGCLKITEAPKLPATTLSSACYFEMFRECQLLETAPVLPAVQLVDSCYYGMFIDCSKLKYIKCLAKDISATRCVNQWVRDVATSGTFVKNENTNWSTGIYGIPSNWTTQTVKPYTINFDANGGTIPKDGNMGGNNDKQATWLSIEQKTGYVMVYANASYFATMRNDCPTRAGQTFLGWYTAKTGGIQVYDNVGIYKVGTYWDSNGKWIGIADLQLYAQWSVNSYTITWLQDDGSLIDKTIVPYGQIPTHIAPTKNPSDQYIYSFAGWVPEVVAVTDNATYMATYSATPITTKIQNITSNEKQTTKKIRNGQLFIQRGEEVFNAQGARVR